MGKFIGLISAMVVLIMAFTGITVYLAGFEEAYDFELTNTSNYTAVYAKINQTAELDDIAEGFRTRVSAIGNSTNPVLGYADLFFYSSWQAVQQAGSSIDVGLSMATGALESIPYVGENSWISAGVIILIVLSIAGLLIGLAMRRDI